jgi:hypothetical protein
VANIDARDISILVLSNEEKTLDEEETKDNPPSAEEQAGASGEWVVLPAMLEITAQWQEELERIMGVMILNLKKKQKTYQLYQHASRRSHGTLGKGNHKPLPSCFEQDTQGTSLFHVPCLQRTCYTVFIIKYLQAGYILIFYLLSREIVDECTKHKNHKKHTHLEATMTERLTMINHWNSDPMNNRKSTINIDAFSHHL